MKKSIALIIFLILVSSKDVLADTGQVVLIGSCDYFLVYTDKGYSLLEMWADPFNPDKDDILIGELNSYGITTMYNKTQGREIKVYVDDYWLREDKAIDKFFKKCK